MPMGLIQQNMLLKYDMFRHYHERKCMYCKNCGKEIVDGAGFCNHCGNAVNGTRTNAKKNNMLNKYIVLVAVLLLVVGGGTVFLIKYYLGDLADAKKQANDNEYTTTEAVSDEDVDTNQKATNKNENENKQTKPQNYDQLVAFVNDNSQVWYVKQYFDDNNSWLTYELGKKFLIVAHNFLNDYSLSSGSYETVGTKTTTTVTGSRDMFGEYHINSYSTSQDIKEWVPGETTTYHGKDWKYNCPTIYMSMDGIDMTGMGGSVYSLDEFRYEKIDGDGIIINDGRGFALKRHGDFLEYCEPDAYGYFQGWYAFDLVDSLVNETYIYEEAQWD